jgi:UDP-glucuronate decarboxylase
MDNLSSGTLQNIAPFHSSPSFTFIRHDITQPYIPPCSIDEIYNLACPASPIQYQRDPIDTLKSSVLGALNLLDIAHTHHAKILLASTSEVYGDPLQHPQQETYWGNANPIGLRACYDEGKRCAETLFMDYYRQYEVQSKIVRIFNTYGPGMQPDDGRVVSNFIRQALNNEYITIYGDGTQTRSFQYVDDLIDGLLRMMQTDSTTTGPVNLGNPEEYTILQLAATIKELIGSTSRIVFCPLPQDDPKQRKPNITLAKQLLH